jgi:hypothetical protein
MGVPDYSPKLTCFIIKLCCYCCICWNYCYWTEGELPLRGVTVCCEGRGVGAYPSAALLNPIWTRAALAAIIAKWLILPINYFEASCFSSAYSCTKVENTSTLGYCYCYYCANEFCYENSWCFGVLIRPPQFRVDCKVCCWEKGTGRVSVVFGI